VATAVVGAARACIADPDAVLVRMLEGAVDDLERLVRPAAPAETRVPEPVLV
jgi:hypothetical protein